MGPDGGSGQPDRYCSQLRLTQTIFIPAIGHIHFWVKDASKDPNAGLLLSRDVIKSVQYCGKYFKLTDNTGGEFFISENVVAWWA